MFLTKSRVNWAFSSGEEVKNDLKNVGHVGFPIGTILTIFDVQVTLMLSINFQVNWHFGSGEEAKKTIFKMAAMATTLDFRSEQF